MLKEISGVLPKTQKGILLKAHMYKLCSIPCGMQHNSYAKLPLKTFWRTAIIIWYNE